MRLRDRLLTPQVARAITSPSGILAAGGAASLVILAGALPLAPVAAIAAWAVRVAIAVPRAPAGERIDPFVLGDPWRRHVQEALAARARYDRAVRGAAPGPLQDRLREIGERLDTGVQESWRIARRGDALEGALRELDVASIQQQLATVASDQGDHGAGSSLAGTEQALRAQLSAAERMHRVASDARDRLRLLDARLDEAVARAIELSLETGDDSGLTGLGTDVDQLVGDMESLRTALEEAGGGTPAVGTT